MDNSLLNTPEGMKSYLPVEAEKFEEIRDNIAKVFKTWGYQPVMTPVLEYYDSLITGMGQHSKKEFYKMIDYDGNILALRPEMTAPIARTVVNRRDELTYPLRLYYFAPVFRYDLPQIGKNREIYQMGLEFIGDNPFADAEIIITAIEAIKSTGIENFKIDLGHTGYLEGIIAEANFAEKIVVQLKDYLNQKDFVGFKTLIEKLDLQDKSQLEELPLLRGGFEILKKAEELVVNKTSRQAVEKLRAIYQYLQSYQVAEYVNFDFSLIRGLDYYTGMIFEAFTEKLGYTICGGGRYDGLIEKFGGDSVPAVGFAIGVQRVALSLEKEEDDINRLDALLVFTPRHRQKALEIAKILHKEGYRIIIKEIENDEILSTEIKKLAKSKGASRILSFLKTGESRPQTVDVIDIIKDKSKKIKLDEGWQQKLWERK